VTDELTTFDYDVALSFTGEDRAYVDEIAEQLRSQGIRLFYDRYEQANLWGKDLYEHLAIFGRRLLDVCVKFHAARGRRARVA
jgi:hypothetical protein